MTPPKSLARVRRIVRKFADVEEGTTFGFPAFKVRDKAFAWFPKKREVDPGTLGVRMSFLEREHWIETNPAAFYLTPHYKDYPSLLARPELLSDATLRDLLESGYEYILTEPSRRPPKKRR
ncbi:MAG TPA: MmcQ/YjbR family DNA-binding protein [Gemmatimonadaceae bacterium]|jgi:hypothetical protein